MSDTTDAPRNVPEGWPTGQFSVILADPPWHYNVWSQRGDKGQGSASGHYATMPTLAIRDFPVQALAAKSCVLFLWAVHPRLPDALDVMDAWGFTFKTVAFTWVKTTLIPWVPYMGLGHWTRSNPELCLLGTRGKPKRLHKDVEETICSPVREHSRKPEESYRRIERLVAGPYLELFARYPHPNWTAWGNERRPRQTTFDDPPHAAPLDPGQLLFPIPGGMR